jgi:hypothetical protein
MTHPRHTYSYHNTVGFHGLCWTTRSWIVVIREGCLALPPSISSGMMGETVHSSLSLSLGGVLVVHLRKSTKTATPQPARRTSHRTGASQLE